VLAEQQEQAAGGAVGEVEGVVVQEAADEIPPLAGGSRGAGPALRSGDVQLLAALAIGGPGQEVPDVVGGGAGGQPGFGVALAARGQGEVAAAEPEAVAEPEPEAAPAEPEAAPAAPEPAAATSENDTEQDAASDAESDA